jgi:hypothetical protein
MKPFKRLSRILRLNLVVAVIGLLLGLTGTASVSTASTVPNSGSTSHLGHFIGSESCVGVAAFSSPLFVGALAPGNPFGVGEIGCNYDGMVSGSCVATNTGATEACDRKKHYGRTPRASDREAVGAGAGEVDDHDPPLIERFTRAIHPTEKSRAMR